jgi:DNA-3-methyladenine glycosylase
VKKLPHSFYLHDDVVAIARQLLGKVLVTEFNGERTSGRIVETEAYAGVTDRASHASKGKTPRTAVMFGPGGTAYIYLCYGIHQMFNIVSGPAGLAHAILVRATEPLEGTDIMLRRTGKKVLDETITRGPGNVGKAFGFHTSQTGQSLLSDTLFIADDGYVVETGNTGISARVGVAYAGADAMRPYRFFSNSSPFVSGKKTILY